jgi:hypothetical protein
LKKSVKTTRVNRLLPNSTFPYSRERKFLQPNLLPGEAHFQAALLFLVGTGAVPSLVIENKLGFSQGRLFWC